MSTAIILTVVPFFLFFSGLFIYNAILAPYAIYADAMREAQNKIGVEQVAKDALTDRIDDLRKQLAIEKSKPRDVVPHSVTHSNVPAAPILTGIRIASQKRIASDDRNLSFGLEIVVQTDVDITPVALELTCDGAIGKGDAGLANGGVYTLVSKGVAVGKPNIFIIKWKTPSWTSQEPIVFRLYSNVAIRATSVSRVDYTFP